MIFLYFIISYLIGSIPGGYMVAKLSKGIDIRKYGSGNAGTTNVLRVLGKKYAIITFIFDAAKGLLVVSILAGLGYAPIYVILAGILVIVGHNWPVFFGFKGGRGIATSIGVLLGVAWQVILIILVIGLTAIYFTRYVSLGSILGAVLLTPVMIIFGLPLPYVLFGLVMSIMAVIRHLPNLKRLINGTEYKIGEKVTGRREQ